MRADSSTKGSAGSYGPCGRALYYGPAAEPFPILGSTQVGSFLYQLVNESQKYGLPGIVLPFSGVRVKMP